jgi:DNA (cytosine-5)-methyltransferase 1
MKQKPKLLDLFSGAGGSATGYARAGFEVVGIDIAHQPHYPFEFHQADALQYLADHGHEFDAIHASPPCQAHSALKSLWAGRSDYTERHISLIEPTRELLIKTGLPYVIENVVGAPLKSASELCGVMFGLKVYRHRLFETSFFFLCPPHPQHPEVIPPPGRGPSLSGYIHVTGHTGYKEICNVAMGIDWMSQDERSQAIPPAYTQFIGEQLLHCIQVLA